MTTQSLPLTLDAEAEATYAYDQIGAFIVFYDMQEEGRRVCVSAIRRKPPSQIHGEDPMKTIGVRDLQKHLPMR